MNCDTDFICCNIYDLPDMLDQKFDIVYTSYGTISWLPDLLKWGQIISTFLKPNGKFIFVEFHPIVWMFDDNFTKVAYNYSSKEAIIEEEEGTYANREAKIKQKYVCWNHGLSDVINSLIQNNLEINSFKEYSYSPYNALNHMEEIEPNRFQIKKFKNKVPLTYSIVAKNKS